MSPDAFDAALDEVRPALDGGDTARAIAICDAVVARAPAHFRGLQLGAIAHSMAGDGGAALARFRAALALEPASSAAWANLAQSERRFGRLEAAVVADGNALTLAPGFEAIARNRVLALNLVRAEPARMLEAARAWAAAMATSEPPPPPPPPPSRRDPGRRLRIGYLVEHILTHDYTCLPLVENHGADFETVVYLLRSPFLPDIVDRYRAAAGTFRALPDIANDALVDRIRDDDIDILIEGAGIPSPGHRLRALARGPARIRAHFPPMGTTGMSAVDAVIADPVIAPPGCEGDFVETIRRVPLAYHFDPLMPTPEPGDPPMTRLGHPTFGAFNSANKIRAETLAAWGELLRRVPDARLIIKIRDWTAAGERDLLRSLTIVHGIAPERIEIRPPTPSFAGHYAAFGDIDVALDSFPYCGVTTTAQALWMGVPVVTLAGRRILERYGAALNRIVGMDDCVTEGVGDYVRKAEGLVRDPERLIGLRRTLRTRMRATPLCDAAAFTRSIEDAYRALWRDHAGGE